MTDDEKKYLKEVIAEAIQSAVHSAIEENRPCNECCKLCDVTGKNHSNHHQMLTDIGIENLYQNHRFVNSVRDGKRVAAKAGLTVIVVAFLGFLGAALWHHIVDNVGKVLK